jgi:hypothetical protein
MSHDHAGATESKECRWKVGVYDSFSPIQHPPPVVVDRTMAMIVSYHE